MSTGSLSNVQWYDYGRRLLAERDAAALLRTLCASAREVTGARVAALLVPGTPAGRPERIVVMPSSETIDGGVMHDPAVQRQIEMRRAVRTTYSTPDGPGPMLVAPFATIHEVHGWLTLQDTPDGFTEHDEQLAAFLANIAAVAYENILLSTHEEDAEFALSVARIGLAYRDLGGGALEITRSLGDLLGLPHGTHTIPRAEFLARMHPDDVDRVDSIVREAVAQGTEFNIEFRFLAGERGWRWFRSNGRVRINAQGQKRIFSGVVDITERRALESQVHQAQKLDAIGQLAGGVAHDFNNVLTAILGFADLLKASVPDPSHRDSAAEIIKAAERGALLTRQLLAFSVRRQPMETTVIDVNVLVTDMSDMLRRLIDESVTLTTSLAAGHPRVRAADGHLDQVLLNLVLNARDAIDGRGTIHLATSDVVVDPPPAPAPAGVAPGRYVLLTVSDTGRGMTDEVRARLFEPFFSTKSRAERSGLGLATVYGIVAQCGGVISVTSELGAGSTFRVYLPRHNKPEPAAVAETPQAVARGGETVLIAEDERSVRRLASVILEHAGYTVVAAANAAEAEERAGTLERLDLLLADVIMPGGNGPDLFRRLCESRPDLKVLFMSGYAEKDLFDRAHLNRDETFIAKPFSAASLAAKVRQILDH